MNKEIRLSILIALVFLDMLFFWNLDISTSAMINDGVVTNGFVTLNPVITYHIGLWGAMVVFVILVFMHLGLIMKRR